MFFRARSGRFPAAHPIVGPADGPRDLRFNFQPRGPNLDEKCGQGPEYPWTVPPPSGPATSMENPFTRVVTDPTRNKSVDDHPLPDRRFPSPRSTGPVPTRCVFVCVPPKPLPILIFPPSRSLQRAATAWALHFRPGIVSGRFFNGPRNSVPLIGANSRRGRILAPVLP